MVSKLNVPLGAASAQQRTFKGLRIFNLIRGFLHLIQGIFMWVVSNDKTSTARGLLRRSQ